MADTDKPAAPGGTSADAVAVPESASSTASPPPAPPSPAERARPVRSGRLAAGLALMLALVALLGSGYLWYRLVYQRPPPAPVPADLPQALAQLERSGGETRAGLEALRTSLAELERRLEGMTQTQGTLKAAIDNLQASIGRSQTQWQLAEAEQLLLIANRRLQLGRNVPMALAALHAADRQLERLASPNLLPVRRAIAREIGALEALERADITGIALRLGNLAQRADELPVGPDLEQRAQQVAAARGAGQADRGLWQDLLSLVRIRRHDEPQKPLLPPEQRYFAQQNLRLMLYGAQHALLQGNVAVYEQNLATAGRWLEEYFDPHAAPVRAAREEIAQLRQVEIAQELPDISASLEMLRRAQTARQEGA